MNPCFYLIWNFLYKLGLKNNVSENLIRNNVCGCHAISCVILTYLYINNYYRTNLLKDIIVQNSMSYFLWDACYPLVKKINFEYGYLLHHLISYIFLNEIKNNNSVMLYTKIFYYGELSNLFNYLVYYSIKKNSNNSPITKYLKYIQFVWFSVIRLYNFAVFTPEMLEVKNKSVIGLCFPMFVMSLYWTNNMYKRLPHKLK